MASKRRQGSLARMLAALRTQEKGSERASEQAIRALFPQAIPSLTFALETHTDLGYVSVLSRRAI